MGWLLTPHVCRYQRAFPIEQDEYLLSVLRYVERNPLRADLIARAEDWPWSSLRDWVQPPLLPLLDAGPVLRPSDWASHVNQPMTEAELERIRRSGSRGSPFGSAGWVEAAVKELGLESTLRPPGRPRKGPPLPPEDALPLFS